MCWQDHNTDLKATLKVASFFNPEVPATAQKKDDSTPPISATPWLAYQPPKSVPLKPSTCSNCRKLNHALLVTAAVAIFSPILIFFTGPLQLATQLAVEITIRLLFYSAACFPVAGMAASYDALRKQPYRNVCMLCCLHAFATAVALRGMSCLHASAPPAQTVETVEFWAQFIHGVLLQPAMWITGGDLDDFPFSEDARVQIWMLCMLCSGVLGLGLGFGLGFGKATSVADNPTSSSFASLVEKTALPDINNFSAFFAEYEEKIKESKDVNHEKSSSTDSVVDQCLIQHRKLSYIEAGFISTCSISGFWLLLTVVGTFATAV